MGGKTLLTALALMVLMAAIPAAAATVNCNHINDQCLRTCASWISDGSSEKAEGCRLGCKAALNACKLTAGDMLSGCGDLELLPSHDLAPDTWGVRR